MRARGRVSWLMLLAAGSLLAPASSQPSFAQAAASTELPDVIGLRIGMSPDEAYKILAARANGAKVGVAQTMLEGIDKPVVVLMALQVRGVSPGEEITVYLTYPPQKQVVWGIRRTLRFEEGKQPTREAVFAGLREKYGPEINGNGLQFWMYDEQGRRANSGEMIQNNCLSGANLAGVENFVAPQPISPLPYLEVRSGICAPYVSLRTEIIDARTATGKLVDSVSVVLIDPPLGVRSREAYKALLAGGDAARRKQELEKANQQKKPEF